MRFSARTQPPTLGNSPRSSPRKSRTCEAVDLQRLPGLQSQQHDLNVQGDASHFVNTLWLATQSRAFTYRYAEIQPGGFLKDHIQKMPIHIDFPAHCPDEVHFQDINAWGSISWMRREPSSATSRGTQKSMALSARHLHRARLSGWILQEARGVRPSGTDLSQRPQPHVRLCHFDVPGPSMVSRRWTDAQGDPQSDATNCW